MTMTDDELTQARIQVVKDHMRLEIEHDWDAVIATFDHPRYEFNGGLSVADGEEAVRAYFANSRTPFPDQGNEIIGIGAGGDCVFVEFWLTGTHLGPLRTANGVVEPTGRAFRVKMMAAFEFAPGSAKIVNERPYTNGPASITTALGL
jgi:limonene-1,2-epoxide hydrolase